MNFTVWDHAGSVPLQVEGSVPWGRGGLVFMKPPPLLLLSFFFLSFLFFLGGGEDIGSVLLGLCVRERLCGVCGGGCVAVTGRSLISKGGSVISFRLFFVFGVRERRVEEQCVHTRALKGETGVEKGEGGGNLSLVLVLVRLLLLLLFLFALRRSPPPRTPLPVCAFFSLVLLLSYFEFFLFRGGEGNGDQKEGAIFALCKKTTTATRNIYSTHTKNEIEYKKVENTPATKIK